MVVVQIVDPIEVSCTVCGWSVVGEQDLLQVLAAAHLDPVVTAFCVSMDGAPAVWRRHGDVSLVDVDG